MFQKQIIGGMGLMLSCAIVSRAAPPISASANAAASPATQPASSSVIDSDVAEMQRLNRLGRSNTPFLLRVAPSHLAQWQDAAKRDDGRALLLIAACYWHGIGVDFDRAEARRYLQLSANQKYPPAMALLASIMLSG